jgi:MraZ protein
MFRGANKVTLDAKGRMAVPTRYRPRIDDTCGGRLVITVDRDYCLLIYPLGKAAPAADDRLRQ